MPDKPTWYGRLDEVIAQLKGLPYPWIDRATVQQLLGVGRRRAQQILQPCIAHQIGCNGLADRSLFIRHLEQLAMGESAEYERRRRQRLSTEIAKLRQACLSHPRVLVEAPVEVVNQSFAGLEGVSIDSGRITVDFESPQVALERLLRLAMAIGNDFDAFERLAATRQK